MPEKFNKVQVMKKLVKSNETFSVKLIKISFDE